MSFQFAVAGFWLHKATEDREQESVVPGLGKALILTGLIIALFGVFLTISGKIPWLGRLPGDIYIKRQNFTFYFPLATSIIISVILSLIVWLLRK